MITEQIAFTSLALLIACIFFAFIPGAGAFKVRANWRRFRKSILKAAFYPVLDYVDINTGKEGALFKFFGSLESIGRKDLIWLKNGHLAVAVNLKNESVYLLPSLSTDEEAQYIPWESISSLVTGTQILVAGTLQITASGGVFGSSPEQPLLTVIYDGDKKTILQRAIRGGRQKNEYWNPFTLISLITGTFALLFLAYTLFGNPRLYLPALLSLTLSFIPIAGLLPPGVFFFFLYQYFWKKARLLRVDRDLFSYPLYPFLGDKLLQKSTVSLNGLSLPLANGTSYAVHKCSGNKLGESGEQGLPPDVCQYPEAKTNRADGECYLFAAHVAQADGAGRIVAPEDPLLETVLIHGNPQEQACRCNKSAMFFTVVAVTALSLGIVSNLFIIINIFHRFLR